MIHTAFELGNITDWNSSCLLLSRLKWCINGSFLHISMYNSDRSHQETCGGIRHFLHPLSKVAGKNRGAAFLLQGRQWLHLLLPLLWRALTYLKKLLQRMCQLTGTFCVSRHRWLMASQCWKKAGHQLPALLSGRNVLIFMAGAGQGGASCLDKGCFPLFLGNRTIVCSVAMYVSSRDKSCLHQGN